MSEIHGNEGLLLNSNGEISSDKDGLWTGSCIFTVPAGRLDLVPAVGSLHPHVAFLKAERFRITFAPGLWKVVVDYVGGRFGKKGTGLGTPPVVDEDSEGSSQGGSSSGGGGDPVDELGEESEPQYELSAGMGTEPIETHPKFADFAGTPSNPLNGARWINPATGKVTTENDAGAVFDGFSKPGAGPWAPGDSFAGVTHYLCMNNTVWTKTWTSSFSPVSGGVQVTSSPPGPVPSLGDGVNWLQMPVSFTKRGDVYSCSQRWIASGPGGHNQQIYS